ncbi:MAG: pseudouridine synthase, partial [Bacteroidota bacterium]
SGSGYKKPYHKKDGDDRGYKKKFDRDNDSSGSGYKKPYHKKDGDDRGYKKKFDRDKDSSGSGYKKPYHKKDGDDRGYKKKFDRDKDSSGSGYKKPYHKKDGDDRGYKKKFDRDKDSSGSGYKKPYHKKDGDDRGYKKKFNSGDDTRGGKADDGFKKRADKKTPSFFKKDESSGEEKKPFYKKEKSSFKKPAIERDYQSDEQFDFKEYRNDKKRAESVKKDYHHKEQKWKNKKRFDKKQNDGGEELIRLNKYIANTGACSRREADQLIASGVVTVNGKTVTELGTKIHYTDKVTYGGQALKREENVYLLLNKPKDFITTVDDPQNRRTVMDLVAGACKERIYPVGRLDRNTTGLLLFTNDGELTKKLTHPSYNIKKVYHVMTDQNVSKEDLAKLRDGFELEDGFVKVDDVQFVGDNSNKRDIGVEIHSGRNRIVRRMFEHLGYKVIKLDRVMFAGLTKKDLPRGRYRFLTAKEISFLKMI